MAFETKVKQKKNYATFCKFWQKRHLIKINFFGNNRRSKKKFGSHHISFLRSSVWTLLWKCPTLKINCSPSSSSGERPNHPSWLTNDPPPPYATICFLCRGGASLSQAEPDLFKIWSLKSTSRLLMSSLSWAQAAKNELLSWLEYNYRAYFDQVRSCRVLSLKFKLLKI